jgi:hypothetical protein
MRQVETDLSEIWALFKESRESERILTEEIRETNRMLTEKFKETDLKFKETNLKFKETDLKFEETAKQLRENAQQSRMTDQRIGRLTGRWGEFVEGLIAPSIVEIFNKRGIDIENIYQRATAHKGADTMEIDILGVNGEYAVVVEAKSRFDDQDVKDFLEDLKEFKRFFPTYADKKIIGAIAAVVMHKSVGRFAYKRGLFVIGQSGDRVKILNDEKFRPMAW